MSVPDKPARINDDNRQFGSSQAYGDNLAEARLQPGDLMFTAQAEPVFLNRHGFLVCDGTKLKKASYPRLYAAIGDAWSYDGPFTDEFRLPDFRSRVPVAAGPAGGFMGHDIGDYGGSETTVLTEANLPPHRHQVVDQDVTYVVGVQGETATAGGQDHYVRGVAAFSQLRTDDGAGTSDAFPNLPPYAAITVLIKT